MTETTHKLAQHLWKEMLRIRRVEERLAKLYQENEIKSLMHLSTGQEAVAVGVCASLRQSDSIVSTHRCHAHYLAKGGSLKRMLAELAGKVGGSSRGRGGSMHLFDADAGINVSLPLVGGSIPLAVGIGLSIKLQNTVRVSVAFFGDGAVEEGVFWERMNFAAAFKLKVIFVCENNLYATHSHILKRQPSDSIAERIRHCPAVSVDGNDVLAVFHVAARLIENARRDEGPAFLEAKTYRLKEHWGPGEDWYLGYRSRGEGVAWQARCPIARAQAMTWLNVAELARIEAEINSEIDEAVRFAHESQEPTKEELDS